MEGVPLYSADSVGSSNGFGIFDVAPGNTCPKLGRGTDTVGT